MENYTLETSHGTIHAVSYGSGEPALLLIHGNSGSMELFKNIFEYKPIVSSHRILSFDLPGHGKSSDAPEPERSYTQPAYAEVALEVLRQVKVKSAIIYGSSLGGHIGIELIALAEGSNDIEIKGLMIGGTPPSNGREQLLESFTSAPDESVGSEEFSDAQLEFSDAQVDDIIKYVLRAEKTPELVHMLKRSDGRARKYMVRAFVEGKGVDQRKIVKEMKIPLAVVDGTDDLVVKLDVLDRLEYGNLWKGECIKLKGIGHAPFFEKPEVFNPILKQFVDDCSASG